ncbi:MAG: hypothetical protein J0I20_04305 [Chloroflexi bacterium]|nr:hypothetical protein [Chloroflexota bacterium]OJW04329.1 MAG: hypothetical protein BGO39_11225 [Chloroflexi bacterium 54-19]
MLLELSPIITWLLEGDVAVQYQTQRDLLDAPASVLAGLRDRIATEGWGKRFLDKRDAETGLWGNGIYSPKWISTHYTLLDLKNLGLDPANRQYIESSEILINAHWGSQGQAGKPNKRYVDMCIAGMALSICCYCHSPSPKIKEMLDYILAKQFPDGGWNCRWHRGATNSSLHTTITVLEALRDYQDNGYAYRLQEVRERIPKPWEFILSKRLFRSSHTGEIIDPKMLMLSYPSTWRYDILRCMDYFASVQTPYDNRMDEALDLIIQKKRSNNHWPVQHKHPGIVHFDMEKTGSDSRWNTLRVLRVLRFYNKNYYNQILS